MLEWLGWIATALFAASYFFKQPLALRAVQALAALLWIVYGVTIHALPVVVANLLVAGMAVLTSFRQRGPRRASAEEGAVAVGRDY